jgi:LppP/LprE lipoprotein
MGFSGRCRRVVAAFLMLGLIAAGCGWKPGSPRATPDTCSPSDGPAADTVSAAIGTLPLPGVGTSWHQVAQGHTSDCRLYWVQVRAGNAMDALQHLLFFDHNTFVSTATPNPRPYTTVVRSGKDTVMIQYQWQQADDQPNRPTGIGTVRYELGPDGKLKALDPLPG